MDREDIEFAVKLIRGARNKKRQVAICAQLMECDKYDILAVLPDDLAYLRDSHKEPPGRLGVRDMSKDEKQSFLKAYYVQRLPEGKIAEQFSVPEDKVPRIAYRFRNEFPELELPRRNTKRKDEDMVKWGLRYLAGESLSAIANDMDMSPQACRAQIVWYMKRHPEPFDGIPNHRRQSKYRCDGKDCLNCKVPERKCRGSSSRTSPYADGTQPTRKDPGIEDHTAVHLVIREVQKQ